MIIEPVFVFYKMIFFLVLLLIGYVTAKIGILKETHIDGLAALVLRILTPALIISVIPAGTTRALLFDSMPFLLAGFIVVAVLFALSRASVLLFHITGKQVYVHEGSSTFGNMAFMGIPLIESLLGAEGLMYASLFIIVDQATFWTLGAYLGRGEIVFKRKRDFAKNMLNPATIMLVLSLVFVLCNFKIPGTVGETITGLGGTTKYISMIYLGGTLAFLDLRKVFTTISLYGICFLKMLLAPIILCALFSLTGLLSGIPLLVITIIAALPTMASFAILARTNKADDAYVVSAIFITTLFSIITIPLVVWIVGRLGLLT